MSRKKILFICKRRSYGVSYGLINSCTFVCNALSKHGIHCKVVIVDDNNDIDREVNQYKPTHVIIEALWVVPSKFEELVPLHPNVKWIVRVHSKGPFLSTEGFAIDWIKQYVTLFEAGRIPVNTVSVATNNFSFVSDLKDCIETNNLLYLPNIYAPITKIKERHTDLHIRKPDVIRIGCFGAIRQLKNQFTQAVAAMKFADEIGKTLEFHMNASTIENQESAILRNIKALFDNTGHELILHEWMEHDKFIELIKTMDLGLQVSFSETFNIVSADFVDNNISVVVSEDIEWVNSLYQVSNPANTKMIVDRLMFAYDTETQRCQNLLKLNKKELKEYNEHAEKAWLKYF